MRIALAAVALACAVQPAAAIKMTDDQAMATSCRTYIRSLGTSVYGALENAISERLIASPNAERFGSTCNMGDYVMAMCKAHPGDDVRAAVERLERAGAAGRLPWIPICGA